MGTISINPDADGDLHDASLHNNKFQTILNEINGNLDEHNLEKPNCIISTQFGAPRSYVEIAGPAFYYPFGQWGFPAVPTDRQSRLNESGVATYNSEFAPQTIANACNIYLNSMFRNTTGNTMTIIPSPELWLQQSRAYNSANVVAYMQKSASFDGNAWADMATATFNPSHGGAATEVVNTTVAFTITDNALPAGNWFRILIQNNSGTALSGTAIPPPSSGGSVFFKALGLA